MKSDRLLAITLLLINRKRMSSVELAKRFEVTERTIYRDMESISQAGVPVVAYPGRNGGFGVLENYKIDRNVFRSDEMTMLITALKGLNTAFRDKKLAETLEKIKALQPGKAAGQRKESVYFSLTPQGNDKMSSLISQIRGAIEENRIISFQYRDSAGKETKRTAEPYMLSCYGYTWYLYCYCYLRNDFRQFRLSRVRALEIKNDSFIPRDVDLESRPWESDWGHTEMVPLVLKFNPKARGRVEDFFDPSLIEKQKDGSLVVRVPYPEDPWVYSFILGFGEDAEVLEPEHVREVIKEKSGKIFDIYRPK